MTNRKIPWFGARKVAAQALSDLDEALGQRDKAWAALRAVDGLPLLELQERKATAEAEARTAEAHLANLRHQIDLASKALVATDDAAILQQVGIYAYTHPLSDAVAYQQRLQVIDARIKDMNRKDGGAVLATTAWQVNGSEAKGRAMVRDISKLLLRAFNAEADNLVRGLKPYKLRSAIERLGKVAETIEKLGKTMDIRIAPPYFKVRVEELTLTADFLQKQSEEKELERAERERLKEERKAQQEFEREKARLEKERQHYENALSALQTKGDLAGAERLKAQLADVQKAIEDVDYRSANIRAGYVYVISNIGSFGASVIKVGMTRRLDPMDRIRELSDASVPFNFDVHALFFSNDAVGIEAEMHARLAPQRCNLVNLRREFFHATPQQAKDQLAALAGELLSFHDLPEALEYRQTLDLREHPVAGGP